MFIFETSIQLDTKQMHCSKTHTKHKETRDMTPGSAICARSEQKNPTFCCKRDWTGYPKRLWICHPWRGSNCDWTQSLATCSRWPCQTRWVGSDISISLFLPEDFWLICVSTNTCSSFRSGRLTCHVKLHTSTLLCESTTGVHVDQQFVRPQ